MPCFTRAYIVALAAWGGAMFFPAVAKTAPRFVRGDVNVDGNRDISDGVAILNFLFSGIGDAPTCGDAADSNDDGRVDLSDAIKIFGFLFLGDVAPGLPGPDKAPYLRIHCGSDPTGDALACAAFAVCPQGPPDPPSVDPIGSPTVDLAVGLTGTALVGSHVSVFADARLLATGMAGSNGVFDLTVSLVQNRLNRLFVIAADPLDAQLASAPTVVQVIQDGQSPTVFIDEPLSGAKLTNDFITVTGRVSDMLSGFMGLEVFVQSKPTEAEPQPANVVIGQGTNGTFERSSVPLQMGENTICVTAKDAVGNTTPLLQATILREEIDPSAPRMVVESGNGQTGPIHLAIAQPIVIRMTHSDGSPFVGKIATFEVVRSDGRLAEAVEALPEDRKVTLQVRTDDQGLAQAYWFLGGDAGCGNNRVRVTSTDIAGTVLFCASATPGERSQINIGSGNNQRVEVGAPATEPLRAWVSDGCNGVPGVPVSFKVVTGGGKVNGQNEAVVSTGPTGHAEVGFVLGPEAGNQVVEASFEGNPGTPAVFVAFGVERIAGGPTRFEGLVLDNAQRPIEGALCTLEVAGFEGLQTRTNDQGQFRFEDLPGSGLGSLYIDGSYATNVCGVPEPTTQPGCFPTLRYEVNIVAGASNSLLRPVLLPPLNPANAKTYNGQDAVELTVEGIDGLKMSVRAGTTVTLRDGTKIGPNDPGSVVLSLNQVHHDDVPMPMPDGAAPPFAWTLQPAGARFEPPVAVTYPNISGLPPGAIAYFLTFNHDTGKFEIFASGHVNDSGDVIKSDPGVGIMVAGWGCNCPPYAVTGSCCSANPPANGCGAPGQGWTVPDNYDIFGARFSFNSACNTHDSCYGSCNTPSTKLQCDQIFLRDMLRECAGIPDSEVANFCASLAYAYYLAVHKSSQAQNGWNEARSNCQRVCGEPQRLQLVAIEGEPPFIDADNDALPDNWETENGLSINAEDTDNDPDQDGLPNLSEYLWMTDPLNPDTDGNGVSDGAYARSADIVEFAIDDSWSFSVGGQIQTVNSDGSFVVRNISIPDSSPVDFVGDDFIRVLGISIQSGSVLYAFTEPFQLIQGQLKSLNDIVVTSNPPLLPRAIALTLDRQLIDVTGQAQATTTVLLSNGDTQDATKRTSWTLYRTSNPAIATVAPDGLISAHAPGVAMITATNEGATAVTRIFIVESTLSTRIEGLVQFEDGSPVLGAPVRTQFGDEGQTDVAGRFGFDATYPTGNFLNVLVIAEGLGASRRGVQPVDGGVTDLGIITLHACPGYSMQSPAKSCLEILQFGCGNSDGKYWIELPTDIVEMHCDFTSDTGGWTRVGTLDTSNGFCGNDAIADLRFSPDASMGKVPDADVQALLAQSPGLERDVMYFSSSDGRFVWHALENMTDYDTSSKHGSSAFYCSDWHCDDGSIDASACGGEGEGCPVTAHGIGGFTKKIYVDSNFGRHVQGMHVNGNLCGMPNYERANIWIFVR